MAYINRLSDINKGINNLNNSQDSMDSKLLNIDGNIESTLQLLETSLPTIINSFGNITISEDSFTGLATEATLLDVKTNTTGLATNTTLTTTNTKLDTINTTIGTTNTNIGTTNTKLDTINTSIGTTNTTLTTINQGTGFNFQGNVYGNVCNNITINANSLSTAFTWTRGTYGRNSVLSYSDTSTSNTDNISIFTTATNGTNIYLGTAYPINIGNATGRYYCFTLNLLPYNSISIRNNSSSNITGVYATLTSA